MVVLDGGGRVGLVNCGLNLGSANTVKMSSRGVQLLQEGGRMVKGRCSLVEGYEERKVPEADPREMFCHSAILVPVVAAGRPDSSTGATPGGLRLGFHPFP